MLRRTRTWIRQPSNGRQRWPRHVSRRDCPTGADLPPSAHVDHQHGGPRRRRPYRRVAVGSGNPGGALLPHLEHRSFPPRLARARPLHPQQGARQPGLLLHAGLPRLFSGRETGRVRRRRLDAARASLQAAHAGGRHVDRLAGPGALGGGGHGPRPRLPGNAVPRLRSAGRRRIPGRASLGSGHVRRRTHQLTGLVAIVDRNGVQLSGTVADTLDAGTAGRQVEGFRLAGRRVRRTRHRRGRRDDRTGPAIERLRDRSPSSLTPSKARAFRSWKGSTSGTAVRPTRRSGGRRWRKSNRPHSRSRRNEAGRDDRTAGRLRRRAAGTRRGEPGGDRFRRRRGHQHLHGPLPRGLSPSGSFKPASPSRTWSAWRPARARSA